MCGHTLRSVPTTSDRSGGTRQRATARPAPARTATPQKINRIASGATGSAENRAKAAWFRRPIGLITAAAAAIAIFLSGSVIGLNLNDRGYEQQQAASLAELTAAADLESATAAVQGGGDAKVIWSIDLERSAVLIDGLPALEEGKTYQLWYIDQNGARGAGTFDVSSDEPTAWRVLDGCDVERRLGRSHGRACRADPMLPPPTRSSWSAPKSEPSAPGRDGSTKSPTDESSVGLFRALGQTYPNLPDT